MIWFYGRARSFSARRAGTGKTVELQAQVARLCHQGRSAFFLAVESLAAGELVAALRFSDIPRFEAWKDSTQDAWFLLDSVDESKLKGQPLSRAVNAFARDLKDNLRRAHVVLSSRVSDWRSTDEIDIAAIQPALAPFNGKPLPATRDALHVVQMAPLNRDQVRSLAERSGIDNPEAFLAAIRDGNAWSFVARPLDVQWVARYWSEYRRLGSLTELINFNITEKLKDKGERPSGVSPARGREGAAELAAVAVLTQKSAFVLPGEVIDPRASDAVDPGDVLANWTDGDIRELLRRSVFDEATIRELLFAPDEPAHIKQMLLALVRHGALASAVDAVLVIALADDVAPALRTDAIEAVGAAGDAAEKARLLDLIHRPVARDPDVVHSLV
jgi:hypothetical protein